MVYLSYLIFSSFFLYIIFRKDNSYTYSAFLFCIFPILTFWIIIIGGQYNVGTDYFSYLEYFLEPNINDRFKENEQLFYYFVLWLNDFGFRGQSIFFIIATIEVIIFSYISYKIVPTKYVYLFFVVFISFSTVFNNQLNAIRQYLVVYLFSLSTILLCCRKYFIPFLLLCLCIFIHNSSLFLFIIFPLVFISRRLNIYLILFFLLLSAFIVILPIADSVGEVLKEFPLYGKYVDSGYFSEIEIKNKLSKLIFLPLYIYSIILIGSGKMKLSPFYYKINIIGIISYGIKILFLISSLTNRFGMYFEILMCIPIVYLLIYLKNNNNIILYYIILYCMIFIYALKVTLFAQNEYRFDSIFLYEIKMEHYENRSTNILYESSRSLNY